MLLLREMLRKISSAGRREKICHEQFAFPSGFKTQVKAVYIFEASQTVGEEQMSGKVGIILGDRAFGRVTADFVQTGVSVNRRKVRAGDRTIAIQQQSRAKRRA